MLFSRIPVSYFAFSNLVWLAPDIFLVAAQRFSDKPDPASGLAFEDGPNGMQSLMVPDEIVAEALL